MGANAEANDAFKEPSADCILVTAAFTSGLRAANSLKLSVIAERSLLNSAETELMPTPYFRILPSPILKPDEADAALFLSPSILFAALAAYFATSCSPLCTARPASFAS